MVDKAQETKTQPESETQEETNESWFDDGGDWIKEEEGEDAAEPENKDAGEAGKEGKEEKPSGEKETATKETATSEDSAGKTEPEKESEKEGTGKREIEFEADPRRELIELRNELKTNAASYEELKEKYEKLEKKLKEEEILDEEEEENKKSEKDIEQEIETRLRERHLNESLWQVTEGPQAKDYPDAEKILTYENQEEVLMAYAREYSREQGIPVNEAFNQISLAVADHPAPYQQLYSMIKNYYGEELELEEEVDYEVEKKGEKSSKEDKEPAEKEETKETKKETKPVDAPGSIAGMPAGSPGASGYTMKLLDEMDEIEMSSLPDEILEKYTAGKLPNG